MRDVAGAQKHHVIAGLGQIRDDAGQSIGRVERHHRAMPARLQARDQPVAIGAGNMGLAGRIDIGDDHCIGIVETGAEIIEQRMQAGMAMRLHDGDDLAFGGGAGGLEHGGDLHRVMAVIVEDGGAVPCPRAGEASLDATETGQRVADRIRTHAQFIGECERADGVEHVVMTGHGHDEIGYHHALGPLAVVDRHAEPALPAGQIDIMHAHVRLPVGTVGHDSPVLDTPDEILHRRVIDAHYRETVERDVLDEAEERRLDRVIGLEMIEMLGIDIGDNGIVTGQLQEGAVGFVGLDHHPVALAHTGVRAIGVDDAAIDHRRIESPAFQKRGDDGGGGGLAVGAGDGDRRL